MTKETARKYWCQAHMELSRLLPLWEVSRPARDAVEEADFAMIERQVKWYLSLLKDARSLLDPNHE